MSLIKANAVQIGQSPTATQNFTLAVPSSPDGTIKLARGNAGATTQDVMNVSNAGVVSFPQGLGNISNSTAIATGSTNARSLANRFADVVNVKDFGAVGDGVTDDTIAIKAAIVAGAGKVVFFPAGTYSYAGNTPASASGTTLQGEGRNSSIIKVMTASPSNVFWMAGTGSGIRSMGFIAGVTQTGGQWITLAGIECFIEDFSITGDFNGIYMVGSVARIRDGRFNDSATGATRIFAGGGDNSQYIDNVLMGAPTIPNTAAAGIRVTNSGALSITNSDVLQQGRNLYLLADATGGVYDFTAVNCYFDNGANPTGSEPIKILGTSTTPIVRCRFISCWASGSTNNGILIENNGTGGNVFQGFDFIDCQALINIGSGLTTGGTGNISDVKILGGNYSADGFGVFIGSNTQDVIISSARIGAGAGVGGNNYGISLSSGCQRVTISNNNITANAISAIVDNGAINSSIINNIGYNPVGSFSVSVTASPMTYTAGKTPTTISITGGTVSSVVSDSQTLFTNTNCSVRLGANKSAVITYSSSPTITATID